jgi:hypothetical protein
MKDAHLCVTTHYLKLLQHFLNFNTSKAFISVIFRVSDGDVIDGSERKNCD